MVSFPHKVWGEFFSKKAFHGGGGGGGVIFWTNLWGTNLKSYSMVC